MVKILKCYNFRTSTLLKQTENEPACLASGGNFLFIGSHHTKLEVFCKVTAGQKGLEWNRYCSFQTGAQVSQIEYNETGDYIATIERKCNRRTEVISVKVYLNWHIAANNEQFRTRVRVAGLGYRSTNVQTGQRLEVVDVPCERYARFMTSCQQTGNLGIVFDGHVKLYHMVEKTIPNSQTTFLDVILFLELQFTHSITCVSLCEDFIACSSPVFVQVFQVNICNNAADVKSPDPAKDAVSVSRIHRRTSSALSSLNIEDRLSSLSTVGHLRSKVTYQEAPRFSAVGERGSTTPSPAQTINPKVTMCAIEDDSDFIHWTFSPNKLFTTSVAGPSEPDTSVDNITMELKALKNLGKEEKPEPVLPVIRDLRGGNHVTTGKATITQLMYQYLDDGDVSWIHLQLIPTYLIGKDENLMMAENGLSLHSTRRSSLVGMSCLMSGSWAGFMFSLLPTPSLLSTYKYSSAALQIQSNGRLLYVLVENGLEIYTTRCQIAAVHNTEQLDDIQKTCPRADEDICMCGVQQFLGPRQMTLMNRYVILFNKMDNAWNINIMEEPSAPELYQDMFTFGERYQLKAPHTYHHLLLECHMTLKSSLIGQSVNQSEVTVITDLLLESSALLGEYYALPDCTSWQLCLPYYNMSGLSLLDVVRQAVQNRQHTKHITHYGEGLVQYLTYTLFLDEDPLDLKQGDGDFVLQVCHYSMPEKLADIVLFSRLTTYSPEKALTLLKSRTKADSITDSKSRIKDRLAFVSLNLQLCEPDVAISSLSVIDKNDLIATCLDHPQMLHTSMTEFSPLSQLLRCRCPQILIDILVLLHDRGTMSMDLAMKLLQGMSGVPEIHKNTHIRDYLEALVNDECRKFNFDEAVPQLCDIYIRRLKDWEPPSIRQLPPSMKCRLPNGNGHFGRRHSWLDNLPPFTGARSVTRTCRYVVPAVGRWTGIQSQQLLQCHKIEETCSCFLCNEDLLKLQALLCYSEVSKVVCNKVLTCLQGDEDAFFYDSIAILCLLNTNFEQSVSMVVNRHPMITAEFGASMIKDNVQWENLLTGLLSKIGESGGSDDTPGSGVSIDILRDVLKVMSQILKPEVFLSLLPGNGNFFFFLPYIRHCLDTNRNTLLKHKVLTIGEKLTKKLE